MAKAAPSEVDLIREKDWPPWAENALQGVAYWIGHRKAMYQEYPLAEGALVAELCNLIGGKLSDLQRLRCEVMYSELLGRAVQTKNTVLTERARADLVVVRGPKSAVEYVMEVKRLAAGNAEIDFDLRRLAELRRSLRGIRAFLLVVSESQRPRRFVGEGGGSKRGMHSIPGDVGHYRVRRTLKAASVFSDPDHAQYCCLVEVFGKRRSIFIK